MKFQTKNPADLTADCAICAIFENDKNKGVLFEYLNKLSKGELERQVQYGSITGKFQETFKYSINEKLKVVLIGLGKKADFTRKRYSQCIVNAAKIAKTLTKNQSVAFEAVETVQKTFNQKDMIVLGLCALRIGFYEFNKYLSRKTNEIETVEIICNSATQEIEQGALIGAYTSFAMKFTKDLVNESAQVVTPQYVANLAAEIAKEHNLKAEILEKDEIKKLGMNAFLAVGQGSVNEPRFIHLTYCPAATPRKKVALIGKGITFDAGGMNIKPATSMLTMKCDMTGAATVLGIIQAMSKLKSDIELHAICALCENMTSGSAYKQGDVLTAMNGKTIEVTNTDAEGRITLADALSFCDTLDVDEVIDIATLTGAVTAALGNNITAVLGNNQKQIDKFLEISAKSAENTWQMPILEELKDNLKSEIADFKNTGGRAAGTSTAAWFLSNFTKSNKWLHLDIAGTAYLEKSNRETSFGPTGVMVRSLINYLLN